MAKPNPQKDSLKAQLAAGIITEAQLKSEYAKLAEINKIKAKERRLAAAAQEEEIAGNYLLANQADILTKKFGEQTKNATKLNDLRDDLLTKLVGAKDNLTLQKSIITDHTKQVSIHADMRTKEGQKMMAEVSALEQARGEEERRLEITKELESKANGMLDGLEGQIKGIPMIGGLLAQSMDFGGLKKQMGGILSGITTNFMTLTAGGMGAGKAIGQSFMTAMPQVAAFGATLWASLAPILPIILLVVAAMYLIKKAFDFNQKAFDLARDLSISNEEAREMSHSFSKMSADSKDLAVNAGELLTAQKELSKELGMSTQFSEQMLTDQVKLTKFMGMSAEEGAAFFKVAKSTGLETRGLLGNVISITKEYNDLTKAGIKFKDINKEILAISRDQLENFKGNTKEMILTVIEAKALGTTIEDINTAANATLDIEESLRNEAKARMLTGVSINNNEIRHHQQLGHTGKVLELQKAQIMALTDADLEHKYQRDAIAAAMGKTSDELLKQRDTMKLMKEMHVESLSLATRDQILASSMSDEKKEAMILANEELSAKEKASAVTDKLNDQMEDMMGPIMDMIDPLLDLAVVLMPVLIGAVKIVFAPLKGAFKALSAIINGVKGVILLFTDWQGGIKLIKKSINDYIYAPLEAIGDMIDGLIEGLSFGMFDGFFGDTTPTPPTEKIDDGIVKPDGTVVKTNPSDFIMAMLDPMDMFGGIGDTVSGLVSDTFGGVVSSVKSAVGGGGNGGGSYEFDYEKLAAAMSTRPIVLNIDGKSVSAISKVQTKQASFRK